MYFSDVYADRPIPANVRGHKLLYGALSCKMFTNGLILFTVYLTMRVVFCQISYRYFQNIGYFPANIVVNLSHSRSILYVQ